MSDVIDERTRLRVLTEPLGGAPLAAAAIAGHAPAEWYPRRPDGAAEWVERAALVRRDVGMDWLDALRPAFGGGAVPRLVDTARAGGVVVTTGQQPGLFGGPIYSWSKALSALALADALERATGVRTAPVFWAATDDADFAEASVTHVAVPGGVETLRMRAPAVEGVPMSGVPLGDVRALIARLAEGAGSAPHPAALDAVRRAYGGGHRDGATVGSAYVALLRELLEPLGIAVLDASHPAVRAAGAPLVRRALAGGSDAAAALDARAAAVAAAGFGVQVASVPGLSLVFHTGGDGRKQRVAIADAARVAGAPADALSPNVLLRPVMERCILPTVAYVAGPGEFAYFAQVSAVAEALGAPQPLAVPRWSGTIVEPHVHRLLDRLGADTASLRDPHAAAGRLARAAMPAELRDALEGAHAATAAAVARLRAAEGGSAVPAAALAGAERALAGRVERLERRYVAAFKRRESETLHDLATARGALWPLDARQERVLNVIPILARHGSGVLAAMRARADETMAGMLGGVAAGR